MSTLTKDIISNAKFMGQGLGSSSGYMVPEIYTDSLLTYLIHRFGWISANSAIDTIFYFLWGVRFNN